MSSHLSFIDCGFTDNVMVTCGYAMVTLSGNHGYHGYIGYINTNVMVTLSGNHGYDGYMLVSS